MEVVCIKRGVQKVESIEVVWSNVGQGEEGLELCRADIVAQHMCCILCMYLSCGKRRTCRQRRAVGEVCWQGSVEKQTQEVCGVGRRQVLSGRAGVKRGGARGGARA
jgi:hypothetical protein